MRRRLRGDKEIQRLLTARTAMAMLGLHTAYTFNDIQHQHQPRAHVSHTDSVSCSLIAGYGGGTIRILDGGGAGLGTASSVTSRTVFFSQLF